MDQRHVFHLFWPENFLEVVLHLGLVREVYQVLVRSDERDVAQPLFEVHAQRFDSVRHRVGGLHARQSEQELLDCALVLFLLKQLFVAVFFLFLLLLEEVVLLLLGLALGQLGVLVCAFATVLEARRLVFAGLLFLPEVVFEALVLLYLLIQ